MKYFQYENLNRLVQLFKNYLDDSSRQSEICQHVTQMSLPELNHESPEFGGILTFLCYDISLNQHQRFEHCFLYLLNTIFFRLISFNKRWMACQMLLSQNRYALPIIFLKLIDLKCFDAAEQTMKFLNYSSEVYPLMKIKIRISFYQINQNGKLYLHEITKFLNHQETMIFANLLIKAKKYFNLPEKFLSDWLTSKFNVPIQHFEDVFLSREINPEQRKCFLKTYLLSLNLEAFSPSHWKYFYNHADVNFPLLDKIICRKDLDEEVLSEYLDFVKKLYTHQHITYAQCCQVLFGHPREGFSPLHEILVSNRSKALVHYLKFIEEMYLQKLLDIDQIQSALSKINSHGFNALYQSINNFSPDIPFVFLHFYMKFFSKEFVYLELSRGFTNDVSHRRVRYFCHYDKPNFKQINHYVYKIRCLFAKELGLMPQNSLGFFARTSGDTNPSLSPIQFQG